MRLGAFAGCAIAALATTRASTAGDLTYEAEASCPAAAEVHSQLEARAPHRKNARIAVRRDGADYRGELWLGDGAASARAVTSSTCQGVIDALVLVVALAQQDEPPAQAAPEAPLIEDQHTPPPPPLEPSEDGIEPSPPTLAPAGPGPTTFFAGLAGGAAHLGSATWAPGAAAFLDLVVHAFGAGHASTRIALAHTLAARVHGSDVELGLTNGRLEACPLGLGDRVAFDLCGAGELGTLRAGAGVSENRWWAALGGAARTRVSLSSSSRSPFIEAAAAGMLPLVRDRFLGARGPEVSVSIVVITFALGLGVALP